MSWGATGCDPLLGGGSRPQADCLLTTSCGRLGTTEPTVALTSAGSRLKAGDQPGRFEVAKVTLVDNYDSFTWNLFHDIGSLGADVTVVRNDATTVDDLLASEPDAIVISPGPCTPRQAGISLDLVKRAGDRLPVLGVCLGHQAIGDAYGGGRRRGASAHARQGLDDQPRGTDPVSRDQQQFQGDPLSLADRRRGDAAATTLIVTARSDDGAIMGLSHRAHPVHGVQFHPESIASENGRVILKTFLDLAAAWHRSRAQ